MFDFAFRGSRRSLILGTFALLLGSFLSGGNPMFPLRALSPVASSAEYLSKIVPMNFTHIHQPAVLLAEGRVFIPDFVGSEIYNPESNRFGSLGRSTVCLRTDCAA